MTDCTTLDQLTTPYLDGALAPAEREALAAHLHGCPRCQKRVAAEATARQVLRSEAHLARARGVTPSWTPRVSRLGKPPLVVEYRGTIAAVTGAAAVVAAVMMFRPQSIEAVGVISDSHCVRQHHLGEPFNPDEHTCTLNCVERGARFVLLGDGVVYSLRNQDFPGLADFAGARVVVSGTPNGGQNITLYGISAAPAALDSSAANPLMASTAR